LGSCLFVAPFFFFFHVSFGKAGIEAGVTMIQGGVWLRSAIEGSWPKSDGEGGRNIEEDADKGIEEVGIEEEKDDDNELESMIKGSKLVSLMHVGERLGVDSGERSGVELPDWLSRLCFVVWCSLIWSLVRLLFELDSAPPFEIDDEIEFDEKDGLEENSDLESEVAIEGDGIKYELAVVLINWESVLGFKLDKNDGGISSSGIFDKRDGPRCCSSNIQFGEVFHTEGKK